MTILWANNAATTLAGAITNVATSCNVATGTGVLFPNPTGGNFFCMTFVDQATGLLREIVHVTNVSTDTFTIVRAQESTTALNWNAGDLAQNLVTAGTLAAFQQGAALPTGALTPLAPPVITTTAGSHPFTPSANATGGMLIKIQSPGGAGGGATSAGAQISIGQNAGAGAYLELYLTAAEVTAHLSGGALPITLGAAGVPASGGAGGDGGDSTIGTAAAVATIPGGKGGQVGTVSSASVPFTGVGAAGGAIPTVLVGAGESTRPGGLGAGVMFIDASDTFAAGGGGASSQGPGGSGFTAVNIAGLSSPSYGGGGGASFTTGTNTVMGGAGGGPWMSIQEFAEAA